MTKKNKGKLLFLLLITSLFLWTIAQNTITKEKEQRLEILKKGCEWGIKYSNQELECNPAPCKRTNIMGKDCVEEGYTGTGLFGLTDWNTLYYVCKDYGRIALKCEEYYTKSEYDKMIEEIIK